MQTMHCKRKFLIAIANEIASQTAEKIHYIIVYFTISFHTILHIAHREYLMNRYGIPPTISSKYQNANRK